MADFVPPSGPPPPKVPAGWTARWNDQYNEWFYVNIYTKKSQWDKPTEAVYPSDSDDAPPGAPPGYIPGASNPVGPEKSAAYGSNNPYGSGMSGGGAGASGVAPVPGQPDISEDERLARQLQDEEDQRSRGQNDSYYGVGGGGAAQGPGQAAPQSYDSNDLPPREQKKGLLGKLSSKFGGGSSRPQGYAGGGVSPSGYRPQQQYGNSYQGGYQPQQGYGGYPQQQQGYGPPQGYYGGGGGYGQPMYGQQPQRRQGGLGTGGALALGAGGGLLGGMMLGEALDGGDGGGDGGGDYGGGGDDGGGGGDFGGGDGGGGGD